MDYALSALSALFPRSLAKNIAFLFSNSPTYLSLNFAQDAIPEILKDAPQFLLDNPIALQKKFLEFKDDPSKRKMKKEMQREVEHAELRALEMLCDLFDWLDVLEPQPTTEIVALYKKSRAIESKITDTLNQMDQASDQMAKINKMVEELQKKSAVSVHPLASGARFLCSLDVGHGWLFQIRKDHQCAGLEAAASFHSQLPLHHA